MESLPKGTELAPGPIVVPEAEQGAPLVLEEPLERLPFGRRYRGRQSNVPILITVLDPLFMARKDERRTLLLTLRDIQAVQHRNLLPIHGFGRAESRDLVVEAAPTATTLRTFVKRRVARGKRLDADTLFAIAAHLCNGLAALHRTTIHGFLNADNVWLADTGRVFLSGAGFGAVLARAPGFSAADRSGALSSVPPEQRLSPPQLGPAADIFALAAMFAELLAGRPFSRAGEPLTNLGIHGPDGLVACIERATAPSVVARPPDIHTFKAELSEAVSEGPVQFIPTPKPSSIAPLPPPPEVHVDLPAAFGTEPAAPVDLPPPAPTLMHEHRRPPPPTPGSASRQLLEQIGNAAARIVALEDEELEQYVQFVDGTRGEVPPMIALAPEEPPPAPKDTRPSPDAPSQAAISAPQASAPAHRVSAPDAPGPRPLGRLELARVEARPSRPVTAVPTLPPHAPPARPECVDGSPGSPLRLWLAVSAAVVAGWAAWIAYAPEALP